MSWQVLRRWRPAGDDAFPVVAALPVRRVGDGRVVRSGRQDFPFCAGTVAGALFPHRYRAATGVLGATARPQLFRDASELVDRSPRRPREFEARLGRAGDSSGKFHEFFAGSGARRGELVIFEYPYGAREDPEDYVKRVIGLPGDVLSFDEGHPIINGWRVPSCRVGSVVAPLTA